MAAVGSLDPVGANDVADGGSEGAAGGAWLGFRAVVVADAVKEGAKG